MTAQLKTDLGVRRASYGEWVEVPAAAGAVYAQIREHPTVLYEVVSLLYRPAEQHLQFNYGVLSPAYRVTPALVPDGLLVSPYLANVDDLARFMSGGMPRPVRAFQIMAGQAGLEYGGSYDVRFYSMTASS